MINLFNIAGGNVSDPTQTGGLEKLLAKAVAVAQAARASSDKVDKLAARADATATQTSAQARDARAVVADIKKQLSNPNLPAQARSHLEARLQKDEGTARALDANASRARQVASQIAGRAAQLNDSAAEAELGANQVAENANFQPPFKLRAAKFPDTFQADSRMMAQRRLLLGGYARRVA